ALAAKPIDWRRAYMRVGEVEAFVRKHLPTKLPDRDPARLGDGTLVYPHELLFLMPIRALIESRNGGLVDGSKYFAVGTMGQQ
ncbi:hypothetical protein, partial [Escherichia coli]|uniref:hypothetical protein n=1 Tax=Escherichia coli TaxID=562 RepID=UPI001952C5CD